MPLANDPHRADVPGLRRVHGEAAGVDDVGGCRGDHRARAQEEIRRLEDLCVGVQLRARGAVAAARHEHPAVGEQERHRAAPPGDAHAGQGGPRVGSRFVALGAVDRVVELVIDERAAGDQHAAIGEERRLVVPARARHGRHVGPGVGEREVEQLTRRGGRVAPAHGEHPVRDPRHEHRRAGVAAARLQVRERLPAPQAGERQPPRGAVRARHQHVAVREPEGPRRLGERQHGGRERGPGRAGGADLGHVARLGDDPLAGEGQQPAIAQHHRRRLVAPLGHVVERGPRRPGDVVVVRVLDPRSQRVDATQDPHLAVGEEDRCRTGNVGGDLRRGAEAAGGRVPDLGDGAGRIVPGEHAAIGEQRRVRGGEGPGHGPGPAADHRGLPACRARQERTAQEQGGEGAEAAAAGMVQHALVVFPGRLPNGRLPGRRGQSAPPRRARSGIARGAWKARRSPLNGRGCAAGSRCSTRGWPPPDPPSRPHRNRPPPPRSHPERCPDSPAPRGRSDPPAAR